MRGEDFLERFRALEAEGRLTDGDIETACAAIAALGSPSREAIHTLCGIATSASERSRTLGQRAIFSTIVETLSDSFEPRDVATYDRIFAQIIEYCRRRPEGLEIDRALDRFGIQSESDLVERKRRVILARKPALERDASSVKRVFALSRVTMGADVAVTSVIMNGLSSVFPNALITLIGPPPIGELYQDTVRYQTIDASYARRGDLMDRLSSWIELTSIIDRERRGLAASEYVIVDPDSRFTQLGLLPVTEDEHCYFLFESRAWQWPGVERLSNLAAEWTRQTFGAPEPRPFVSIPAADLAMGQQAVERLNQPGAAGIVAFNFGSGGNASKRLTPEFEMSLTMETLNRRFAVVLDKGVGEERERANALIDQWRQSGRRVMQLDATTARQELGNPAGPPVDAVTWEGGPGGFAALIASADLYVGYDSGFQHIAAALGRPLIDMFVRPGNDRFAERWTPFRAASNSSRVARLDHTAPAGSAVISVMEHFPQSPYRRHNRR